MSRPAQRPHASGRTLHPPPSWASRQRQNFRAAPGSAPAEDSASTRAGARGPSQGAGLAQPGYAPARAPTRPSLVRLLVQRLHVAGPAGSGPGFLGTRPHGPPSGFRLPASGRRTRPLLPARAAPARALPVVTETEEEGDGRRGPDKKAKGSQRHCRRSGTRKHSRG